MKRFIILTVSGMLACAAFAADTPAEKKGGNRQWGTPEQRLEMISKQLDLTADQQAKVKALFEQEAAKMRENREKLKDMTPEQRREHMMQARKDFDAKLKDILTPEQYAKWEKHRAARMEGEKKGGPGEKKGKKGGKE